MEIGKVQMEIGKRRPFQTEITAIAHSVPHDDTRCGHPWIPDGPRLGHKKWKVERALSTFGLALFPSKVSLAKNFLQLASAQKKKVG